MTNSRIKLSDILEQVKTVLKKAIDEKETGVTYAYKNGEKFLSFSIENVVDDLQSTEEKQTKDVEVK